MSASAVSITANPGARRRPVVVGEKKSNMEMFTSEDPNNSDRLVAVSQSKDPSHHSVLERTSKDPPNAVISAPIHTIKKSSNNNSTISPVRRTRKAAVPNKPEKPRWLTVLSIFTKNFVLLLVLIGLVQIVRRLALNPSPSSPGYSINSYAESEARIAEVESLVKNLVKMLQVQVEVVDKKIDSQVGGLRMELEDKIRDKGVLFEGEFKQLIDKFDNLDKSVTALNSVDWLSKEDFNKFVDEYLNKGKNNLGNINLDDIRAYARDFVVKEIEKHAADGLGMVDFALASAGGSVVKHSAPFYPGKGTNWFSIRGVHPLAVKMLEPSFGEPGQCFPLKGSTGFVQIRLRDAIIPQAVTLEHVAKTVAYDRSSAPKDCQVSGWLQGDDLNEAIDTGKMFLLSEFTYDLEKSNAQTFSVLNSEASRPVDTVRLDFTSNHGSSSHTCIYRFRVHGYQPDSLSVMAIES